MSYEKDKEHNFEEFKKSKQEEKENIKTIIRYEKSNASPDKIAAQNYKEIYSRIVLDLKSS